MEKFEGNVKFVKQSEFMSFYGYNNMMFIYKFETEDGKILVWKTGSVLQVENGEDVPTIDSTIHITASIKGEGEYRGEKQTIITRVKVLEIVNRALTKEEKDEIKADEQRKSLKGEDFIWVEMPYRQYKNNYADCETVAGSYDIEERTIDVIIREGRLKNSGVRGQFYYYWVFKDDAKELVRTIKAVSFENAYNRVTKENPNHEWSLDHFEMVSHGW